MLTSKVLCLVLITTISQVIQAQEEDLIGQPLIVLTGQPVVVNRKLVDVRGAVTPHREARNVVPKAMLKEGQSTEGGEDVIVYRKIHRPLNGQPAYLVDQWYEKKAEPGVRVELSEGEIVLDEESPSVKSGILIPQQNVQQAAFQPSADIRPEGPQRDVSQQENVKPTLHAIVVPRNQQYPPATKPTEQSSKGFEESDYEEEEDFRQNSFSPRWQKKKANRPQEFIVRRFVA